MLLLIIVLNARVKTQQR